MTISDSLLVINTFPIPDNQIVKICILRGLDFSETFSKVIGDSQSYELATADTYLWLASHPSITEQEVGVNNAVAIKTNFVKLANAIYGKYGDPLYTGKSYGFIGDSFNG